MDGWWGLRFMYIAGGCGIGRVDAVLRVLVGTFRTVLVSAMALWTGWVRWFSWLRGGLMVINSAKIR